MTIDECRFAVKMGWNVNTMCYFDKATIISISSRSVLLRYMDQTMKRSTAGWVPINSSTTSCIEIDELRKKKLWSLVIL